MAAAARGRTRRAGRQSALSRGRRAPRKSRATSIASEMFDTVHFTVSSSVPRACGAGHRPSTNRGVSAFSSAIHVAAARAGRQKCRFHARLREVPRPAAYRGRCPRYTLGSPRSASRPLVFDAQARLGVISPGPVLEASAPPLRIASQQGVRSLWVRGRWGLTAWWPGEALVTAGRTARAGRQRYARQNRLRGGRGATCTGWFLQAAELEGAGHSTAQRRRGAPPPARAAPSRCAWRPPGDSSNSHPASSS